MRLPIRATFDGIPVAEHVDVTLEDDGAGGLTVGIDAPRFGDPPPDAPPGPVWQLWEHEVVEVFVLGPGERYTELELGPHGHHLLLRLEGRRNAVERCLPVAASWSGAPERWQARAHLPATVLPPRPWHVNAYAIHGIGPARRYLAHAPVEGPDFHQLERFVPFA